MATYVYIITLKCLEAFSKVLYLCFTYCWFSLSTCSSFGCSIQRATCQSFLADSFILEVCSLTLEVDGEEEGIKCNWSVYKTTPHARKSKKGGSDELASLEEANDDSESLTAFLVGFEQEE
ncbi:hypothetical protein POTOM_039713 [Populus tomentosa]|uniref:Uncharacterized protein n=1 Tax=Populus tomentosa TaxID=118781 RepID=A0A8X7YVR9_POPTO|nr:hypothetical protein POTOM_039713 [Populus tomentosa]